MISYLLGTSLKMLSRLSAQFSFRLPILQQPVSPILLLRQHFNRSQQLDFSSTVSWIGIVIFSSTSFSFLLFLQQLKQPFLASFSFLGDVFSDCFCFLQHLQQDNSLVQTLGFFSGTSSDPFSGGCGGGNLKLISKRYFMDRQHYKLETNC